MKLKKVVNFISLERDNNRYQRGIKLLKKHKITTINLIKKDAFDFLETNCQKFDFIFLDAVKRDYYDYLIPLKDILNQNGILICDNVLFGGKVLNEKNDDKYKDGVRLMRLFNKTIAEDQSLSTMFLPIGDGLSISIKNN